MLTQLIEWDYSVFRWFLVNFPSREFAEACHFLVKNSTIGIFMFLIFLYQYKKRGKISIIYFVGALILIGISDYTAGLLKAYFHRPRPMLHFGIIPGNAHNSFPSAHSMNSMALAVWFSLEAARVIKARVSNAASVGLHGRSTAKRWGFLFFGLAFFIGFMRILGRDHFPADVLAGFFFGSILGVLYYLCWLRITSSAVYIRWVAKERGKD